MWLNTEANMTTQVSFKMKGLLQKEMKEKHTRSLLKGKEDKTMTMNKVRGV